MGEILKRDSVSYRGPAAARPAPKAAAAHAPAGNGAPAGANGAARAEPAPRGPVAKLLRVGEELRAIEVRCRCGESILVELDYPEDQARGESDR